MRSIIFVAAANGKVYRVRGMTRDWSAVRVVAHRCGGEMAPENSLAGLDAAARSGVPAVEFDVMLSADGEPFLIHDETLERTTNGRGRVAETAASILRQLSCGRGWLAPLADEPIPSLEEALARCRALGLLVNIEIKPAAGFDVVTGEVVAARALSCWSGLGGRSEDLLLSSFSVPALIAARRTAPLLRQAWLLDAPVADWQEEAGRLGVVALHCSASMAASRRLLAEVSQVNLALRVYTVNDLAVASRLLTQGVDAVFSDRCRELAAGLPLV